MFIFALALGFYSYIIFFLGIIGFLTRGNVSIINFLFTFLVLVYILRGFALPSFSKNRYSLGKDKFLLCLLILLVVMFVVNLVGALAPELAFDALWYHLTLPKVYLASQKILFVPGGLLYYSAMPKLSEMLY